MYMYISIDIGGTTTRVASSHNLKDIVNLETFPSQKTLAAQTQMLSSTITKVSAEQPIHAYCVGVAGLVDTESKLIIQAPNYKILNSVSIPKLLGVAEAGKVHCLNDTKMAALGEAVLGAAKGKSRVAYLSIGTGVGGALIVDSRVDMVTYEPGHQIVNFDDLKLLDGFGLPGVLESYLAGPLFEQRYGIKPDHHVPDDMWFAYGRNVGLGVHNMIFMWNPEVVVIGGGMSIHYEKFLPGLVDQLRPLNFITLPHISKAQFEQGSGIVGGFVYLSQVLQTG
jgi:predicted NBD/HSP70 family sugar kinase